MEQSNRLRFCPQCGQMVDNPDATECPSCQARRPARDWPEVKVMFQRAVCTQCYNLLEDYTTKQCPECRTVRPERGWILLPYTVAGHYRLLSQVFRDEISAVFVALELNESRSAVLLRLGKKVSGGGSSQVMTLFRREQDMATYALRAGVEACNRVTGVEATGDGLSISVQDYHGLRSLDAILRSRGPFEPDDACKLGIKVADILQQMHENGLVHGNLTTNHILVDHKEPADGATRVVGLEYACYNGDCPAILAPESPYVAPEAMIPGGLTPASDYYSLGAIIWELITGRPPEDKDISHRPDGMPTILFVELGRLLRKDVRSRVEDAKEIVQSLKTVSELLWQFDVVGSECKAGVDSLKAIDEKVHELPYLAKSLANNGYPIVRINRFKKELDHMYEQIGALAGDPRAYREKMMQIGKHVHRIQEIIQDAMAHPEHGSNKKIIGILGGVLLLLIAASFGGRSYWMRSNTGKAFTGLQGQCVTLSKNVKNVADMLSLHRVPVCNPGKDPGGHMLRFDSEVQAKKALTNTVHLIDAACNKVKKHAGKPGMIRKRLTALSAKVDSLVHACITRRAKNIHSKKK